MAATERMRWELWLAAKWRQAKGCEGEKEREESREEGEAR